MGKIFVSLFRQNILLQCGRFHSCSIPSRIFSGFLAYFIVLYFYPSYTFAFSIDNLDKTFFSKDEIAKLHTISEEKRLSAIKHEIDSYVVSNHVRYFKKDGGFVWTIYRAHYDLNQSTCVTKLKLLTENTLIE